MRAALALEAGSELEIAALLVQVRGDRFSPRDVSCGRAVGLAEIGVSANPEELVVPLHDLHPVGLLDAWRVGMERGDRRLLLVVAELTSAGELRSCAGRRGLW